MVSFQLPLHQQSNGSSLVQPKTKKAIGASILALCILNIALDGPSSGGDGRRSLLSNSYLSGSSTLLPWAETNFVGVESPPDPDKETGLFWHIPKSGGTTAKRLYQCMGHTLAHRVGAKPEFGHDKDTELVIFEPHADNDWKVANVDTTVKEGIIRAKQLGLVESHSTDLIFTMEPEFAGQYLYDEENKGRLLALFRHPVDRAFSMYYYLQTASWEKTYHPEWATMSPLEWANLPNAESNYMVHKLVGKAFDEKVNEIDLIMAKELVRQRFIVGLMEEMNESIRRFNIVLGVDEHSERGEQCMKEFNLFGEQHGAEGVSPAEEEANQVENANSNSHPKFEEGSPEYEAISERNNLDMILYEYIENLFQAQREIIDSYANDESEPEEESRVASVTEEHPNEEYAQEETEPQDEEESSAKENEKSILSSIGDKISELASAREKIIGSYLTADDFIKEARDAKHSVLEKNLANVDDPLRSRDDETLFFWHIPKSGRSAIQNLYWCMGATIANEVGKFPMFGHEEDESLVAFAPWLEEEGIPGKVINVDLHSKEGIMDAKNKGFLTQPDDIPGTNPYPTFITTQEFKYAVANLFSEKHKARMFTMFRNPVDLAASRFYDLKRSTWDPDFSAPWAKMTLSQYAEWSENDGIGNNNLVVRILVDKTEGAPLTDEDLEYAKELVSNKFVVGLLDKFEESVHRFNLLIGVNENDEHNKECITEIVEKDDEPPLVVREQDVGKGNKWNSHKHPTIERGSDTYNLLARIHSYDMKLYEHIYTVFEEQKTLFGLT